MKSNASCGYIPPTPGYGPCTRDRGHDGPCAHDFADSGTDSPANVREITREFLDYANFHPSEILFGKQWGEQPTIITEGERVMGVMVPVPNGCGVSSEYAKHIACLLFKLTTRGLQR